MYNDSFYRFWWEFGFEHLLSVNVKLLINLCYKINAINSFEGCDGKCGFILFEVCW